MSASLRARLGPPLPQPSAAAYAADRLPGSVMSLPVTAVTRYARPRGAVLSRPCAVEPTAAERMPGSSVPTPMPAATRHVRSCGPGLTRRSAVAYDAVQLPGSVMPPPADLDPSAVTVTGEVSLDPRTGGARLVTAPARYARPPEPALTRRGFPGPAAATPLPKSPHRSTRTNPVPSPAHPTSRAIRVRRSPR